MTNVPYTTMLKGLLYYINKLKHILQLTKHLHQEDCPTRDKDYQKLEHLATCYSNFKTRMLRTLENLLSKVDILLTH